MPSFPQIVNLSEEQILAFRSERSHLLGPGADSPRQAAADILGAQAQQLSSGLLALSLRTKGRPTAEQLQSQLLAPESDLVRTWGQRETLHLYAADPDWRLTQAARSEWAQGIRGRLRPPEAIVDKASKKIQELEYVRRQDLFPLLSAAFVRSLQPQVGGKRAAERSAAGLVIYQLAMAGEIYVAEKKGAEQNYRLRKNAYPTLSWPKRLAASTAARTFALRYFRTFGPATPQDLAHFFHARVAKARQWMVSFQDDLVEVQCGRRKDLFALREDLPALQRAAPKGFRAWPVRLLPLWDCWLMAHADKSWTAPEEADRKRIWRKAAYVSAVVMARGRAVALWSHLKRKNELKVEVTPLSLWKPSQHLPGVRREAKAIAKHFGLAASEVEVLQS